MKYLLYLLALCLCTSLRALPAGSALYPLPDGALHVRLLQPAGLGAQPVDTAILLISGPNQHFFADSGWFALLQGQLAQQHRTYAIDRQSSGFSSDTPKPSYRKFATDLARVLPQLAAKKFLLVSFASGSITARLLADNPAVAPRLAGLVLIDPDVPTPAALALYNGAPADWYRANLAQLLPQLATTLGMADPLANLGELVGQLIEVVGFSDIERDAEGLQLLALGRRNAVRPQQQQIRAQGQQGFQLHLAVASHRGQVLQFSRPLAAIEHSNQAPAGTQLQHDFRHRGRQADHPFRRAQRQAQDKQASGEEALSQAGAGCDTGRAARRCSERGGSGRRHSAR